MRHSAITFAEQVKQRLGAGENWDIIFCSDMLNLAEFRGLAPAELAGLPTVIYFHENQLTYPVRFESERDYQFAMTNITSALAADQVWFNSGFHREDFLSAVEKFLVRMPDYQPRGPAEAIGPKSLVQPPGIDDIERQQARRPGPLRILWVGRWEHDKAPELFFEALKIIKQRGTDFRISVIGPRFRQVPEVFEQGRTYFAGHIDRWGFQQPRSEYEKALAEADVVVSTALHEFFGLSVVEAIAAGAYPLLPQRLAYPELLGLGQNPQMQEFFYDGSIGRLAERLLELSTMIAEGSLRDRQRKAAAAVERFKWKERLAPLDTCLEEAGRAKDR